MIQLNLLPDVKLEYVKARRTKRLLITSSVIVASVSLGLAVLTFLGVNVVQKARMRSLNDDIIKTAQTVRNTPNIDRSITVQNQLQSLPALHEAKPATTRLFDTVSKITPANISISKMTINYTDHTFDITGGASDLLAVNTFADTLKFTEYKEKDSQSTSKAFSKVLLSSFAATPTTAGKGATYQITLSYSPDIFDNQKSIELIVPKAITSRSQAPQSGSLFGSTTQGAQ